MLTFFPDNFHLQREMLFTVLPVKCWSFFFSRRIQSEYSKNNTNTIILFLFLSKFFSTEFEKGINQVTPYVLAMKVQLNIIELIFLPQENWLFRMDTSFHQ